MQIKGGGITVSYHIANLIMYALIFTVIHSYKNIKVVARWRILGGKRWEQK
jgi:hypothetical protein